MTDSIAALSETTIATSTVAISVWSEILPWVEVVLMPLVVIVTAIAAWRVQINVLARRTAFDIILNHELNEDWQILQATARARLAERTSQDDWASIASAWSKNELSVEDLKHIQPIMQWLNHMEFVSIGLLKRTIHNPTYAEMWGVSLIQGWERAEPFLEALRTTKKGNYGLFRKFTDLAESQKFRQLSGWTPQDSTKESSSS